VFPGHGGQRASAIGLRGVLAWRGFATLAAEGSFVYLHWQGLYVPFFASRRCYFPVNGIYAIMMARYV